MFEMMLRASEAAAAHRALQASQPVLIPALWGCAPCGVTAMVAGPVWANCSSCGRPLTLLSDASTGKDASAGEPRA